MLRDVERSNKSPEDDCMISVNLLKFLPFACCLLGATLGCDETASKRNAASTATASNVSSHAAEKAHAKPTFVKLAEGTLARPTQPRWDPQMMERPRFADRDAAVPPPRLDAPVGSPPIAIGGYDEVMVYWTADVRCPLGGEAWFRPDATSEFGFTGQKVLGGRIKAEGTDLKLVLSPDCPIAHYVVAGIK
jgi:hypothetical protein